MSEQSDPRDTVDEVMEATGFNAVEGIPYGLHERDYDPEIHGGGSVVVDDTVVYDMMHGVVRENGDEVEAFSAIPLVAEMSGDVQAYVDHRILDDRSGYREPLVEEDDLNTITDFLRSNTSDLEADIWEESFDVRGDDVYRTAAHFIDAPLLTFDEDFSRNKRALTPGNYLEGRREHI